MEAGSIAVLSDTKTVSTEQEDLTMMKEDRSIPGMDYIWYDCLGDN
jgi:hypothetical protein